MFFQVSNFPNLELLLNFFGNSNANSRKNVNNKNNWQKLEIKFFEEKRLLLMNKSLKLILIIPTLNINNFNIKFI
jgi:hypothetical protein